ncbi:MAG: hypothetical protein QF561_06490 [Phycisphaerales bacterium]|jgi:hypothetical protein|nr:hypothetical protein [Phycisphaerales bacterium]
MSGVVRGLRARGTATLVVIMLAAGCQHTITDPAATLARPNASASTHKRSLEMIMGGPQPLSEDSVDALQGLAYRAGYQPDLRVEGLQFLLGCDRSVVVTTLRRRLPRVTDHDWLRRICQFVSDNGLTELDEALVSSWGRPWAAGMPEDQRPEYLALRAMHGPNAPAGIVWETFRGADRPSQKGLRFRCWELLHRLGERDALIAMVSDPPAAGSHAAARHLHDAVMAFGTVPWNREEVLWIEKLAEPSRRACWDAAAEAAATISRDRQQALEIRDLPVLAAAARHRPELLTSDEASLYASVASGLRNQRHFRELDPGFLPGQEPSHRLDAHRDKLTWGDLVAMQIAQEALTLPQVRAHLFSFADRDIADETTEYGGVIDLDEQGRFNVREFPPRMRVHDRRFEASQDMFDAGYTALFHFHYHAQKHRNSEHAGPGAGDMAYADSTRANCLVLTFVDENTMNVDFYRHDGVLVDLGVIVRPSARRDA